MSIDNKDIGCLRLDDFKLWSSMALKVFITEGKANDWLIWHISCKVSHIKIFPYLLELNIVFFASLGGDGSNY